MMYNKSNLLLENLTSGEVQEKLNEGCNRVMILSGSIEQHGNHLPLNTDYILARELGIRAAQKIGKTLVAPVIPIGCSDHHMSFCGTISISKQELISCMVSIGNCLIKYGFRQLLLGSFHGGNFQPSLQAVEILRSNNPDMDIRTALDVTRLVEVTNSVIRKYFPDRKGVDCHAGCVETSMMFFLNSSYIRKAKIENGASISEFPEVFEDMKDITNNGILGTVEGYSSEIGAELFDEVVSYMLNLWGFSREQSSK